MSRAVTTNVYPENPTIDAAAINTNYGNIQTATGLINQENVGFEGIDTRQIVVNPILVYAKQFTNGYTLSGPGTAPAAGALYMAKSDPNWNATYGANVSEIPINHNTAGTKTTVPGQGTKWLLNGANGVPLVAGDVIRIDMDIMAWTIQEVISNVRDEPLGTMAAVERDKLVNGVGGQTRVTYGGNYGSGFGEWCSLIYPKANITSAAAADANFVPLSTAFGITGAPNFGNLLGQSGGVNPPASSFFDLQDDFDQALVLPIHHMSPANNTSRTGFMPYFEGNRNTTYADYNYDQPPLREASSVIFKVVNPCTLYALQLYYSGIWRMATNLDTPLLYLEGQDCDPGLGGQHFGVSTGVYLEECRWGIQIFRNV